MCTSVPTPAQCQIQTIICDGVDPGSYLKSPPAYLLSGWGGGEPPATVFSMGSASSSIALCSVPATANTILGATKLLDTNSCSVSDDRLAVPPSGQIKGRPRAPVYATLCRPCKTERGERIVKDQTHVPGCYVGKHMLHNSRSQQEFKGQGITQTGKPCWASPHASHRETTTQKLEACDTAQDCSAYSVSRNKAYSCAWMHGSVTT